jgi:hypothetical protein
MLKMWISAIAAASFAVTAALASDTTFKLVGDSTKVCQLNGDTDWLTGKPTEAQTLTNSGMYAADLGTPVDTGGSKLYFLFGDTWPSYPPPATGVATPNDAVGTSMLTATPTSTTCLDLKVATVGGPPPPTFAPPTVRPQSIRDISTCRRAASMPTRHYTYFSGPIIASSRPNLGRRHPTR